MPNLNYPDYGMGLGGMGAAPTPSPSGMSSFLPYVAPITGILGTATNAYGTYLQSQQADKQYEESMRRYNEEMTRQAKQDQQAQQQQALQNSLATGQYAANRSSEIQLPYVNYAKQLGL